MTQKILIFAQYCLNLIEGDLICVLGKCESPPGKRALIDRILNISRSYENSHFLSKRLFCEV